MKKIQLTVLLILLFLPLIVFAQSDPSAILEYFEDPNGDMIISDETGNQLETFDMGDQLPPGFSISTGSGVAEIRLDPNGTILKLAEKTDFSIINLQGYKGSPSNEFSLLAGKLRTIAARTSGINYYNVRTPTAVMGVRGTDFINEVGANDASVIVRQGLVEVTPINGPSVMASPNQTVNTLADVFQAINVPPSKIGSIFQSMAFKSLSPLNVPGHIPLETDESVEIAEVTDDETEEETEEETTNEADTELSELTQDDLDNAKNGTKKPTAVPETSELATFLRNFFGMEIGSTTIGGETFAKVIVQPNIDLGKFKMGLYLPIFYVDNIFDAPNWYKPQGNHEWSFGFDQNGNIPNAFYDFFRDLMLKIKYIEYGNQGWDEFYLKIGNLSNMSIGHGTIMNNYANDGEFPAIRKIGLNTGFDFGVFGMELVGDNLADPSIFGTRLFVNPFSGYEPFQIGLTGIMDLFPARTASNASEYGDPWLIAFGLDLEFFKINKDNLKLMMFGDFSTMMPVFRTSTSHDSIFIAPGAASSIFLNGTTFKNFGIVAGLRGSIFAFNWAFEYRMSTGIYKPSIFNAVYDRNKIEYLSEIIHHLDSPGNMGTTMGIYGEGGFTIKDKLAFTLGYFWPWEIKDGALGFSNDDNFKISLIVLDGLIPKFPIHGSISYERTQLAQTLMNGGSLSLFDANTVVYGEVVYPIAQTLDLIVGASTVIQTDPNTGKMIMAADGVTPKVDPVISIETRIHF